MPNAADSFFFLLFDLFYRFTQSNTKERCPIFHTTKKYISKRIKGREREKSIGSYSFKAKIACVSGTTRRLRPLFSPASADGTCSSVGHRSSVHLRNTRFRSRGTPSSTTVEMGMKGRSSMLAASTAYSCANSRALRNEAYCDCAWEPTMMYISKKASRT